MSSKTACLLSDDDYNFLRNLLETISKKANRDMSTRDRSAYRKISRHGLHIGSRFDAVKKRPVRHILTSEGRILLSRTEASLVMKMCYDEHKDGNAKKIAHRLKPDYVGMGEKVVQQYLNSLENRSRSKPRISNRAPLCSITAEQPMEQNEISNTPMDPPLELAIDESESNRILEMNCSSIDNGDDIISPDDVNDRIERLIQSIAEKIKLLTKHLAETTVKKLTLLKQFDEITNLEEHLQKELKEERSKQIEVTNLLNERQSTGSVDMNNDSTILENEKFARMLLHLENSEDYDYLSNFTTSDILSRVSVKRKVPVSFPIERESLLSEKSESLKMEVIDGIETGNLIDALDWSETQDVTEVPDNLKRHITRGYKDLMYKCRDCNRQFACLSSLKFHSRTHGHPADKESNAESDKTTETAQHPIKDIEDPLKCPRCSKTYPGRDSLKRHIRRHCQGKTYPCDQCERTFANLPVLNYHVNRHHSGKPPVIFQCPRCPKSRSNPHWLNRHLRWHDKKFTHLCPTCGKGYIDAVGLKRHIIGKHNKPQFQCEICERYYFSEKYLTKHRLLHTGEFAGICPICGKDFATDNRDFVTNRRLINHMRSHNRPKTDQSYEAS